MQHNADANEGKARAKADRQGHFFARTAWIMLALVLASFPLTYFWPVISGSTQFRALRHLHGALFFVWIALYAWQAQLVAARKVARHMEIGLFGFAVSGAMVPMGWWMAQAAGLERSAKGAARPWESTWYNLFDMAAFTGFMAGAIAMTRRDTAWHRRFAYAAAVNLVGPAFSRWTLKAPLPFPWLDMLPNLLADLFLLALAIHDRRNLGRVHPATWLAIAATVPLHFVSPWIARSQWWNGLAGSLLQG